MGCAVGYGSRVRAWVIAIVLALAQLLRGKPA